MWFFESTSSLTAITTSILLVVLYVLWFCLPNRKKLPPGPIGLPFIGSIPFLDPKAEKTFALWSKKYGPVFSVQLGSNSTVVLNSYEAIEEAFITKGQQFLGRFHTFFTDFSGKGLGIIFVDGEKWKTQRRFGSRALAGAGLHGKSIENRVLEEAEILCDVILSKNEKPFILETELMKSVGNVISSILLLKKCDHEKSNKVEQYVKSIVDGFRENGLAYMVLSILPWTRHFPPFSYHMKNIEKSRRFGEDFLYKIIDEHIRQLDLNDARDFIDLYLIEWKKKTPGFEELHQLEIYLEQLFSAGTETSTSTIRWILLHLIKYPEVQEKIHNEIDEVIGRNGKIKQDLDLPYTKAVIQEGYRIGTVTPLGVPRRNTEDIQIMNHTIPKNTQILPNIWFVHNDPRSWPNPDKFDPTRHLDKDGKFVKSKKVIPFSIGTRNCLGENLARIEIFIFVVSILQKFKVCPNKENSTPCLEGMSGIVCCAPHYPLVMEPR